MCASSSPQILNGVPKVAGNRTRQRPVCQHQQTVFEHVGIGFTFILPPPRCNGAVLRLLEWKIRPCQRHVIATGCQDATERIGALKLTRVGHSAECSGFFTAGTASAEIVSLNASRLSCPRSPPDSLVSPVYTARITSRQSSGTRSPEARPFLHNWLTRHIRRQCLRLYQRVFTGTTVPSGGASIWMGKQPSYFQDVTPACFVEGHPAEEAKQRFCLSISRRNRLRQVFFQEGLQTKRRFHGTGHRVIRCSSTRQRYSLGIAGSGWSCTSSTFKIISVSCGNPPMTFGLKGGVYPRPRWYSRFYIPVIFWDDEIVVLKDF